MAVQLGGGGGVKSDINVTPLVDVMLVLLIIMMIVAPLLQQGVSVKLPQAANTTEKPDTQDQTVLAIDSNKRLYLNTVPVQTGDLRRKVEEVLEGKKDRIVIIKADHGRRVQRGDGRHGRVARQRHRGHGPHHRPAPHLDDGREASRWLPISTTAPSGSSRARSLKPMPR